MTSAPIDAVVKAAHMVGGWHVLAEGSPFCNWCSGSWPCPYRVLADHVLTGRLHSDQSRFRAVGMRHPNVTHILHSLEQCAKWGHIGQCIEVYEERHSDGQADG